MNSLSKGMGLLLGVMAMLWIGTQSLRNVILRDHTTPSLRRPADSEALGTLQQEVTALRNRLAQVERSQPNVARLHDRLTQLERKQQERRSEDTPESLQDTTFDQREGVEDSTGGSTVSKAERRQKLHALFATQFLRESNDPAWSRQTETSLSQAVASANFQGSRLLTVGCRTSLCQMEISHDNESAQKGFIEDLPFTLPFDTEMFYQHLEGAGGTAATVLYLARAGQRLPTLAQ